MLIYKITCLKNTKSYIGYGADISTYTCNCSDDLLADCMGLAENINIEVLVDFKQDVPMEEVLQLRKYFIAKFKTNDKNFGYNTSDTNKRKKLNKKIQVLISTDTENSLMHIINKDAVLHKKRPVSISKWVRHLIEESIKKQNL